MNAKLKNYGRNGPARPFVRSHLSGESWGLRHLLKSEVASRVRLINTGARASARFNAGKPVCFLQLSGN